MFLNKMFRAGLQKTDFIAGPDRFLVCKTDSVCIKHIFFHSEKTHFADHILAQLPGLVKSNRLLPIIIPIINVVNTLELLNREKWDLVSSRYLSR